MSKKIYDSNKRIDTELGNALPFIGKQTWFFSVTQYMDYYDDGLRTGKYCERTSDFASIIESIVPDLELFPGTQKARFKMFGHKIALTLCKPLKNDWIIKSNTLIDEIRDGDFDRILLCQFQDDIKQTPASVHLFDVKTLNQLVINTERNLHNLVVPNGIDYLNHAIKSYQYKFTNHYVNIDELNRKLKLNDENRINILTVNFR